MQKKNIIFLLIIVVIFGTSFVIEKINKARAGDLPDLLVEEITINNDEPDLFENVTITVKVKNNGSDTIKDSQGFYNFSTNFNNFDQFSQAFNHPSESNPLSPGESTNYTFGGQFNALGSQKLSFTIDNGDKIQESDEDNNSENISVLVQGHDLEADSISVTPSSPAQDQNCIITVKIQNAGTYNLYSSHGLDSYSYNIDNFQLNKFKYTYPTLGDLIEPDGYMEFKFYGQFTKQGSQSVEFAIDTEESLDEALEDNNSISQNITVVDPDEVDISVSSISLSKAKPITGQDMEIAVNIKNEGEASIIEAYGLRYNDAEMDFDRFIISEKTHDPYPSLEDPFEPGDTYTYTLSGYFNMTGSHILSFMADKDDLFDDIDRTNNLDSQSVVVYISEEAANEFQIIDSDVEHVSSSSEIVSWETDQETTGKLIYREDYYDSPETTKSTSGEKKKHEVTLTGLKSGTGYVYHIVATLDDLTKDTQPKVFTTMENNSISIIEGPRLLINNTTGSVTVIWETNILTLGTVYYRKITDEEYSDIDRSVLDTYHNIEIPGLDPGSYEIYTESESDGGTIKKSSILSFSIEVAETSDEGNNEVVYNESDQGEEMDYQKISNSSLYNNVKGKIILQVEENGEAYYVHPKSENMYFLGRPTDAFSVMRSQGVGITNSNLEKIPVGLGNISGDDSDGDGLTDIIEDALGTDKEKTDTDGDSFTDKEEIENNYTPLGSGKLNIDTSFTDNQKGMIFLQVEQNGEAWYVNPSDAKRYFLGRPTDAFNVMRFLGLGISNANFEAL